MIRISQLTVSYGKSSIINRLSFKADPDNSPVILAGRNGSGKTSLMKAILGELPYSGKIEFGSVKPSIAWLPQIYHVPIRIPVIDFVAMGSVKANSFLPFLPTNSKEKAKDSLCILNISHLQNKFTDELSGGEWQLVCLAQMKTQDANIWLLDEPTSSLDIGYKYKVFEFLWKESESGKTVVISTHDIPFLPPDKGSILFLSDDPVVIENSPVHQTEVIQYLKSLA